MVLTLKVKEEDVEHKFQGKINALRADVTGENIYILQVNIRSGVVTFRRRRHVKGYLSLAVQS